jgi:predicted regulator of Ras-like GTPase activity (Roadblock/LC7/MglB family)
MVQIAGADILLSVVAALLAEMAGAAVRIPQTLAMDHVSHLLLEVTTGLYTTPRRVS